MGQQVIREATRFSEGLAEDVYRCKSCGYTEKKNRTIDRIHRGGGGPIIMGGGGGFGGFSGGGGGGSWEVELRGGRFNQSFLKIRLFALFYTSGHVKPYVTACVFISYCSFR